MPYDYQVDITHSTDTNATLNGLFKHHKYGITVLKTYGGVRVKRIYRKTYFGCDHTSTNAPDQNSVVKRAWARVILGWVTPWEVLVLQPFFRYVSIYFFAVLRVKLLY